MSDGGKGSKPRPFSVTQDQFVQNWDKIFGKKHEENDTTKTGETVQSSEQGDVGVSRLQQSSER